LVYLFLIHQALVWGKWGIVASQSVMSIGGLPADETWNLTHVRITQESPHERPGTDTAWVAPKLVEYLSTLPYVDIDYIPSMSPGVSNLKDAQPGDIIAYAWGGTNDKDNNYAAVDHLAVVTDISHGTSNADHYPEVSEWSAYGDQPTPYVERGWTWSVKDNMWLQHEVGNENMAAFLIHVRSTEDSFQGQ
jgi:hypothetical protein